MGEGMTMGEGRDGEGLRETRNDDSNVALCAKRTPSAVIRAPSPKTGRRLKDISIRDRPHTP